MTCRHRNRPDPARRRGCGTRPQAGAQRPRGPRIASARRSGSGSNERARSAAQRMRPRRPARRARERRRSGSPQAQRDRARSPLSEVAGATGRRVVIPARQSVGRSDRRGCRCSSDVATCERHGAVLTLVGAFAQSPDPSYAHLVVVIAADPIDHAPWQRVRRLAGVQEVHVAAALLGRSVTIRRLRSVPIAPPRQLDMAVAKQRSEVGRPPPGTLQETDRCSDMLLGRDPNRFITIADSMPRRTAGVVARRCWSSTYSSTGQRPRHGPCRPAAPSCRPTCGMQRRLGCAPDSVFFHLYGVTRRGALHLFHLPIVELREPAYGTYRSRALPRLDERPCRRRSGRGDRALSKSDPSRPPHRVPGAPERTVQYVAGGSAVYRQSIRYRRLVDDLLTAMAGPKAPTTAASSPSRARRGGSGEDL